MRRLDDVPEHLDGDLADAEALMGNLRDLRRINRRFGGTSLSARAIGELLVTGSAPHRVVRVLDVGTGAVDIPRALLGSAGPARLEVTAVDSRREVLDAAMVLDPGLRGAPGLTLGVADGRSLPWTDGAFDVVHASLVLHHLRRDEAVPFLRELARVASIGIVVNDLARSRLAWLGAWVILHALTRNPWTLHDGPLSVRRAWTRAEAKALLRDAGLRPVGEIVGLAGHRWAIAAVRS
jgi:ubiquinone/menaquinone biosynthesis C-methylase UbiE